MTQLMEKTKSIRKTFTIPKYIVEDLEKYSKTHNQKQSQVIALAVEKYLDSKNDEDRVKTRLHALDNLLGIAKNGELKDFDSKTARVKKAKENGWENLCWYKYYYRFIW